MKVKTIQRLIKAGVMLSLATVLLAGCATQPVDDGWDGHWHRHYMRADGWVPAHVNRWGHWVPGHWRHWHHRGW